MNSYKSEPLVIDLKAPNGSYEVTVSVKAHCDTVYNIYSQHRTFAVRDREIKAGETQDSTFIVNVCDRNFHGAEYEKAEGIRIEILSDGDLTVTAMATAVKVPVLYICGDSTVTDQPAEYPYDPVSTYCGWGQAFAMLTNGLAVSNHAQSGSCTKEFMESNLKAFEDKIKPGDYMVIEFGHNDQKLPELDAFGGYAANLERLAGIARVRGAEPIICSPINRIIFQSDGTLLNLLGDYRDAAKATAEKLGCAFIDMWQKTTDYFVTAGPVKSWQFFRCLGSERDYTHTNDIGGSLIARLFAREMIRQSEPLAEYIDESKTDVKQIYADPGDTADSSEEMAHLKTIGLANVPKDIDNDITGLQI